MILKLVEVIILSLVVTLKVTIFKDILFIT